MAYGDHIYVERGVYTHHGIDEGSETVIERCKEQRTVRRVTREAFAAGGVVQTRDYGARLDAQETVARARSMLGRPGYDLLFQNCEHFATWCVTGSDGSAQVDTLLAGGGVIGVCGSTPMVGLEIVTGVGDATALSAPNLMSGLTGVGGSVVGGICVLSGASGLLAAGVTCTALRDARTLTGQERHARRAGRYGAVGGAALGVGVSMYAVGSMGIAGYGAAGLASGLASLGAILGGGMARGIVVTMLIPALLAVVVAMLLYRTTKRNEDPGQRQILPH